MRLMLPDEAMTLTSVRPSLLRREFELRNGDMLVAAMRFRRWHESSVEVERDGKMWEFRRTGLLRHNVGVVQQGYELPFANFKSNFFGTEGILELPRGERIQYRLSILRGHHTLLTQTQEPVLQFRRKISLKIHGEMGISTRGVNLMRHHPWLPMLLWFLAYLHGQKQA